MEMEPNEKKQKIEELLRLAREGKMTPEMVAKMAKEKSSQAPAIAPAPSTSTSTPASTPVPTAPPSHIDLTSIPTLTNVTSPATAPATPDKAKKYSVLVADLYPFLNNIVLSQENGNTVSLEDALATRFDLSSHAVKKLINKLDREAKVIDSTGKVYKDVLDAKANSLTDKTETWDFEDDSVSPHTPIPAPTPSPITVSAPVSVSTPSPVTPSTVVKTPVATPAPTAAPAPVSTTAPIPSPAPLPKVDYTPTPTIGLAPTPEPKPATAPGRVKFTTGDLFDFLEHKLSKNEISLSSEEIQKEFMLEKKYADEIIQHMASEGLLDKEKKIVSADVLAQLTKGFNRNEVHEFDAPVNPLPLTPTPAPTPITPDINLDNLPSDPATSPAPTTAVSLSPDSTIDVDLTVAVEDKNEGLSRADRAVNMLKDLYAKKASLYNTRSKQILIIALSAAALGFSAPYLVRKNGAPDQPNAEAQKQKEGESKPPAPPANKESGKGESSPTAQLNPNYEKSLWWTQLNPEVKPLIEKILKAPDAKSYTVQFLGEIEILHEAGTVNPSAKTQEDLAVNVLRFPNILNVAFSGAPMEISECVVTAQDEKTRVTKTCYLRNNLGKLAKEMKMSRTQALGGNPYQPFSAGTITEDFNTLKNELIAKANAEAVKK